MSLSPVNLPKVRAVRASDNKSVNYTSIPLSLLPHSRGQALTIGKYYSPYLKYKTFPHLCTLSFSFSFLLTFSFSPLFVSSEQQANTRPRQPAQTYLSYITYKQTRVDKNINSNIPKEINCNYLAIISFDLTDSAGKNNKDRQSKSKINSKTFILYTYHTNYMLATLTALPTSTT